MEKNYYQTTAIRNRCKTKCSHKTYIFVGSKECRDTCKHHIGYGKNEKGKYVKCDFENF